MDLKPCKACGRQIGHNARACPHCGAAITPPAAKYFLAVAVCFFSALFAVVYWLA